MVPLDECIYIKECGPAGLPPNTGDWRDWDRLGTWFANGNGSCQIAHGLNNEFCTIRIEGECHIKCGGEICGVPTPASKEAREEAEARYQAFRIVNNASLDVFSWKWYNDYQMNQNGTKTNSTN